MATRPRTSWLVAFVVLALAWGCAAPPAPESKAPPPAPLPPPLLRLHLLQQ